jgi:hypothetical protein
MIGHALTVSPRPRERASRDRWIGTGFAVGSACFLVAPFPGFVHLVGTGADGAVFFAGSVFFTLAAAVELREATVRLGRSARNPAWWSAAVQFAGTLLFNLDTFDAMRSGLSSGQEDRLVFAPDLAGAACFLVSGLLALRAAGGRLMALVNLAGCVLFGVAAVASYVVPSSGSILDLAAVTWSTALGALCFLVGAVLLVSSSHVSKEVSA